MAGNAFFTVHAAGNLPDGMPSEDAEDSMPARSRHRQQAGYCRPSQMIVTSKPEPSKR